MRQITKRIALYILNKFVDILSDERFLKIKFRLVAGYNLNLCEPKTFNEKLQWLKLYEYHPEYTKMVDKYLVKEYVSNTIGADVIIPTLGLWSNVDDINFDSLPNQFVLKCTGDSGSIVICKDKKCLNIEAVKLKLSKNLKQNFFKYSKEYPYRDVEPRIIAEKYVEDEKGELNDYKFFCFNGEVKLIQLDFDRFKGHKRNLYDTNWNLLPVELEFPSDPSRVFPKPDNLANMITIASRLSQGIKHVRIDLYNINKRILFGEMTFFHGTGMEHFIPFEWDEKMGSYIKLEF